MQGVKGLTKRPVSLEGNMGGEGQQEIRLQRARFPITRSLREPEKGHFILF